MKVFKSDIVTVENLLNSFSAKGSITFNNLKGPELLALSSTIKNLYEFRDRLKEEINRIEEGAEKEKQHCPKKKDK